MATFRIQKDDNFVVLDKGFLANKELSWQAKGLLAYMLSLPNDWTFSIADLSNRSKNGRDATKAIINELSSAGYIKKEQGRAERGKFAKTEFLVFETPNQPLTEKPSTVNPSTDNPLTENPPLLSNKGTKNKSTKNKNNVEKLDAMNLVTEIIDYLNAKVHKNFRANTAATKQLVQARLAEGYSVEDFKCVIDLKAQQWLNDPYWQKYLSPKTLFCSKHFDSYLNEAPAAPKKLHTSSAVTPPNFDFNAGEDVG